jgi:hypothetical protein
MITQKKEEKSTVVLIISGSGPADCDGTGWADKKFIIELE